MIINNLKKKYVDNIKYKGKEKLSKVTIFMIVILNIIVFNILIKGISFQNNILTNPNTYYPYNCKNIFNNSNISINDIYYYNYDYIYNNFRGYDNYNSVTKEIINNEMSKECSTINDKINSLSKEIKIKDLFDKNNNLNTSLLNAENKLRVFRENYNTFLFENISNNTNKENTLSVDTLLKKKEYDDLNTSINKIKEEQLKIKNDFIVSSKSLNEYISLNKDIVNKDYDKLLNNYYLLNNLIEILFSLPLLFIFLYFTKKFLKEDKYIHYVISKNILFVVSLPLIWNLLEFAFNIFKVVYKLLPKVFLDKLINLFYSLHLSFLLSYFFMFIMVVIIGFVIIQIQKKYSHNNSVKSKLNLEEKFKLNLCFECNSRVNYVYMNFCPNCNSKLKRECNKCHTMIQLNDSFCYNCGEEQTELKIEE